MTRDNTLNRGVIAGLALTLTFGVPLTAVRADVIQPLPRLTAGDDARWLERLPPATQPLPRPIDVSQSDTGSLQEALKLLESRVESSAFESAPSSVEADETPVREPTEPVEPSAGTGMQVLAPQPPATPASPVAPVPPVIPVAPESSEPVSAPTEATPKSTSVSPPPAPETAEAAPSPLQETPPAAPTAGAGRWQVQLLAGRALSRVERDRDDILRFHGDRFAGLTLTISQASPNGLYRLRALDWPSQAEADAWCRRLRPATGLKCIVVRGEASLDPGAAPVATSPSPAR